VSVLNNIFDKQPQGVMFVVGFGTGYSKESLNKLSQAANKVKKTVTFGST
jgi:hypothetical protein